MDYLSMLVLKFIHVSKRGLRFMQIVKNGRMDGQMDGRRER